MEHIKKKHLEASKPKADVPNKPDNILVYKTKCACCGGSVLIGRHHTYSEKFYYKCKNRRKLARLCENKYSYDYSEVMDSVFSVIRQHMSLCVEKTKFVQKMNSRKENVLQYDIYTKQIAKLQNDVRRITANKSGLYEDYREQLITAEELCQYQREYESRVNEIEAQITELLHRRSLYEKEFHIDEGWEETVNKYMAKRKLTKELVDAFVSEIVFYDDNDWLAIDFCDLYALTKNKKYLEKAQTLYNYIYSGWDDVLGGGIYWCEQKKTSKNTCSNAPATVLCMKLYNLTKNNAYLEQAKKTYDWTKNSLRDPEDFVYWDNVRLDGSVDKAKYTYNSGQMIQAGVLLYQQSGDKAYLKDAQETARGAYQRFTEVRKAVDGTETRFYTASPWFNVILLRGLTALYEVDHNPEYIRTMADNARYAWDHTRDINGFLDNDWTGIKTKEHKWLLDNACMVELFSEINNIK